MSTRITILAAFAFLLSCVAPAWAVDDMDLLGDLDTAMQTEKEKVEEEADKSFAAQAARNGELVVRLRGYHMLQGPMEPGVAGVDYDVSADGKNDYGEVRASFGTSYENDMVRMAASGWLEQGNQDDTYSSNVGIWQDTDRRRNFLEINELYMTLLGGRADLTLGKRVIKNGLSPAYSPGDRISSVDLNDPLDPRRLGAWQAALEGEGMDVSWMVAVLPVFQPPRTPSPESRWIANESASLDYSSLYSASYGSVGNFYSSMLENLYFFESLIYGGSGVVDWIRNTIYDLFGVTLAQNPQVTVEYDRPDAMSLEDTGAFGQARTSAGDFDLLASAYRGPGLYPVLRVDLDRSVPAAHLVVEHPTVNQFTGGVSTPWKGVTWFAEAMYSHSEAGKDDSYVQYVVGGTRSEEALAKAIGLWRIDLGLEYAGEWITDAQDASGYAISSNKLRLGRNDLMPAVTLHLTEDVRVHYMAVLQLEDNASLNRAGVAWDVTERLLADVSMEFFDGPTDTYFGWWRNQDRAVASLTYTF